MEPGADLRVIGPKFLRDRKEGRPMRTVLLWLIGIPIPIIILLWLFGAY